MNANPNKPVIPAVPLDLWRELYQAAIGFQALGPWNWMFDSYMLGIEDGDMVRILAVLGACREVFALVSYRGTTGVESLLSLLRAKTDHPTFDQGMSLDALMVDFVQKKELQKEDLAILKQLQLSIPIKGSRYYPCFRSYVPGCSPWFINQAEAQHALHDLQAMTEFSQLLRQHPQFFAGRQYNEVPFRPANWRGALDLDKMQWHTLLSSPPKPEPPAELAGADWQRLCVLPQRGDQCWELDAFYMRSRVLEGERPYHPKIALLVDARSGMIVGHHLGARQVTFSQTAGHSVAEAITRHGFRPGRIAVVSSLLADALTGFATRLAIMVPVVSHLPMLAEARAAMEARF
jgi:hypothetical protein